MVDIVILSEDQKKEMIQNAKKLSILEIQEHINSLTSNDDAKTLESVLLLYYRSYFSDDIYPYWDSFVSLLHSKKSTQRSRAIFLLSMNAKWDIHHKLNAVINEFLSHIEDEKSITSRQCVKSLENIIPYKTELHSVIRHKLENINYEHYTEGMKNLIFREVTNILMMLKKD